MKDDFTHWFSSKPFDKETGFVVYQRRYYDSMFCRWLSKDPIEEADGPGLYLFLKNDAVNKWDYLGLVVPLSPPSSGVSKGKEGPWEYSATWAPYSEEVVVVISYTLPKNHRKCCNTVEVSRYVRKLLMGGTLGPYVLDHAAEGGYNVIDTPYVGFAEGDAPDGLSFTFGVSVLTLTYCKLGR